jgi:predicted nuclease of restriction endonuclease-like (RecB) superfamily
MEIIPNENIGILLYANLLSDIKIRIRQAQVKATLSANAEMIIMYWDIGKMIHERQQQEGWSASIIPRLSRDLRNELPEVKGFSERNLGRMLAFFRNYQNIESFLPQPVAKMEKIKGNSIRFWYMAQIIQNGWSRDTLGLMIKSRIHERQGKSITNFRFTLPDPQSDLTRQSLKDPYIFDFMTMTEPFNERELKTGDFKPEYEGKMNFYCSAVDDLLRHPTDNATIGLILCQTKDRILAEYALWDINKPIGISEYELTRALPENLRSSLPSIEELEAELGGIHKEESDE